MTPIVNDEVRIEMTYDKVSGFYTMDLIFKPDSKDLKLMWAAIQKHRLNVVYEPEKTWIFLFEIEEIGEEGATEIIVADILNPLVSYLVRKVPDEQAIPFGVEGNATCGGNTIRCLLHPDLVSFTGLHIDDVEENFED